MNRDGGNQSEKWGQKHGREKGEGVLATKLYKKSQKVLTRLDPLFLILPASAAGRFRRAGRIMFCLNGQGPATSGGYFVFAWPAENAQGQTQFAAARWMPRSFAPRMP